MDNILINLDDGINLTPTPLPSVNEQPTILMPSEVNNIPGPAGPPGKDGQDGQAATITVGSTTTGNPGTNASVINSGSSSAAILDFVIPRGATGANGEAATISVGTTTTGAPGSNASVINSGDEQDAVLEFTIPTGAAGPAATVTVGSVQTVAPEYPATVTNSGTTSAAVLDFEIPQGIAGTPGQDGQDGQAATVTVGSTTTGNPGTNASVTNSGTSSAAILDFTIPRGADGVDGQDGSDGAPGQAATITVGSTTTGNAGTNASVTNSGTTSAAVLDFVIPRGADGQDITITQTHTTPSTSESYYAWKFSDGKMICYGTRTATINLTSQYEGSYYSNLNGTSFAETFTDTPIILLSLLNNNSLLSIQLTGQTSSAFNTYVWKTQSKSNVSVQLKYVAYGHWK